MTKLSLKKIKNRESLHPNSRKTIQVNRVNLRLNKLDSKRKVSKNDKFYKMNRYHFIASYLMSLDNLPTSFSLKDLHNIIHTYINRDDGLLSDLRSQRIMRDRSLKRSSGKSSRESDLEFRKQNELNEFKSGFIVPDLTDAITFKLFLQFPSAKKVSKKDKGKTHSSIANQPHHQSHQMEQDQVLDDDEDEENELNKSASLGLDFNYLPQLRLIRLYSDDDTKFDVFQQGQNPSYKINNTNNSNSNMDIN